MKIKNLYALFFGLVGILGTSCSATKSVPEGEHLFTGAEIDMGEHKRLATRKMINDVYEVLSPTPNERIAGFPLRLHLYNLFDNGKEKGLWTWARDQIGEEPVLFKPDYPNRVEQLIANRLFNNGYFDGRVDSEVKLEGKKASVTYLLDLKVPYRIDSISNRIDDPEIAAMVKSMTPSKILNSGDVYTLSSLQGEAQRIENFLRAQGYYFFRKDYLEFLVDSTNRNRTVNLRLRLHDDTPRKDLQKAYIREITVYPDYGSDPFNITREREENVDFVYMISPEKLRAEPLLNNIFFRPGDPYNVEYHQNTLKRLINLSSLSFVNTRFNRVGRSDSLTMDVLLSPRLPQSIQASLGLTYKNSRYIGPEMEVTYINRNLFRGSENLRIRAFANLNFPTRNTLGSYYENSGVEVELRLPGLKVPWQIRNRRELTLANTRLNLKFERERVDVPLRNIAALINELNLPGLREGLARDSSFAPFIGIQDFKFIYGYQWQRRPDILQEFNPVGLGLQLEVDETPELKRLIDLLLVLTLDFQNIAYLEDMIYWNPDYIFTYDSRKRRLKRDNYFYRGRVSLTGNRIFPDEEREFFKIEKLQSIFAQVENDFRYYHILPKKEHTLAARLVTNVSFPFGEELFLPFLNMYTVGGPNSVRAYSLRELGPGTVTADSVANSLWLYGGKGDLHLESSVEFRYKLSGMFELAAFADAGNVWLLKSNNEKANFNLDTFFKELGFGTGLGLRLNIAPLLIRLDLAFPLTKPWLPEGQRWVGNQIDLLSGKWRKENLQFNLSFGYPF